ncbi:NnrS family protein [Photobacterium iliopiscarium]|uniref:NnrS family protein n=1 Tax=Photobacterium iliopiscarium TaxID=56192 RepID=UPI001E51E968|nr:NnrS family protein [Photobacterium iliopiscarium]MCD9467874.1 nnrS family protein [Photobacterium iliopiscarium]MCD9487579.1 NnrS family protein [Photobacterium iliopiscarium]MCF2244247.1 NnrS family protein [Photobacterium iliopiscarium]
MQIIDRAQEEKIPPLFRLAFRPFFIGAAIYAVLSIALWGMFWAGNSHVSQFMYGNPLWWHSHEMLFGFSGAVIVGFLLTAVQTWTGQTGVKGAKLAFLFSLWLIARLGLMVATPSYVWMIIDCAWIIVATLFLAMPIIKVKQWRNLFFVPVLIMFTLLNIKYHLMVLKVIPYDLKATALMTLTIIAAVVIVVGGRVIPFFTSRGTKTETITRIPMLEYAALIPIWILLIFTLFPVTVPSSLLAATYLIAAVTNLVRMCRWRSFKTITVPLLWSLHGAYLSMIIGLAWLGGSYINHSMNPTIGIHIIAIGGIGAMILAMMARVSLGHTGRKLQIGRWMIIAFISLLGSLLARTLFVVVMPVATIDAYVISAVLWVIAFTIFAIVYFPVLTKARVDGHPG